MLIDDESRMKKYKPDRRVAKTKKAICNAFLQLLSKKDFNEITIKEIADTADVNRKTIYNYYSGIYQILDDVENTLVSTYEGFIEDIDFKRAVEDPYSIFNPLANILNENMDLYGSLIKTQTNSQLLFKIMRSIKVKLNEALVNQHIFSNDKVNIVSSFIVSGMVACFQEWFESGRSQTIEDFSKDLSTMILNGVKELSIL